MLSELRQLTLSETGKDTIIVFWGTVINVVIGGIFFIVAPRLLGPSSYGLFATVYATSLITVRLTSLGIETGILRFTNNFSKESNEFISIALKWYLFLGLLAAVIGYFISPKLASLLGQPQILTLLRVAFASTILFHLTNLFTSGLQAKREFKKAAIILIANNTLRLVLVFCAAYFLAVNLTSLTFIFFFATLASVVIGIYFMPIKITKINRNLEKKFFKFNIWIWFSLTLATIPFDNYLLLKIAGPLQTGLYAAPYKLLNYTYQVAGNFTAVLASRYSSFENVAKAKAYSKKAAIFPLFFSLAFLFSIVFADPITSGIFGKSYIGSVQIFRILSLGSVFFFMTTIPSSIILYYFGKPQITFSLTVLRITLNIILLLALVQKYQGLGAAIAFMVTEIIIFAATTAYCVKKLKI